MAEVGPRRSKRLRLEAPEDDFDCFFCNAIAEPLETRQVQQLACCSKFVHIRCQIEWELTSRNTTCGHCRQTTPEMVLRFPRIAGEVTRMREERQNANRAAAPATVEEYVPPTRDMTREEIIQRLRTLLNTDDLENHLQAVNNSYIYNYFWDFGFGFLTIF